MAWIPTDSTLAARLALVRQKMGWNITEAARECGLSESSWRQWEHGTRPRDLDDTCTKIAEATGCDKVWLALGRQPANTLTSSWRGTAPDLGFPSAA
jgi:transcriptional regulator with XRE-family HTH domain